MKSSTICSVLSKNISQSYFYYFYKTISLIGSGVTVKGITVETLNKTLFPFKIFKGIESDILNDGSLDYNEGILKTFDFIVASVHSNLKMNEEQVKFLTHALIALVEDNPEVFKNGTT